MRWCVVCKRRELDALAPSIRKPSEFVGVEVIILRVDVFRGIAVFFTVSSGRIVGFVFPIPTRVTQSRSSSRGNAINSWFVSGNADDILLTRSR